MPGLVTVTLSRVPGLNAGTVAATWVEFVTETLVAGTPPTCTVAPETKFEPVIVTAVPPDEVSEVGLIASTDGAPGGGVGVSVGVRVTVGVRVLVGVDVLVAVKVRVGVFVKVGVRVFVKVGVGVRVAVGVGV